MGISFSTPYYLSGRSARSWHTNKGEKSLMGAGIFGAAAYGLSKPQFRGLASDVLSHQGFHISPETAGAAVGVAAGVAGASAAYSGYHYYRAARYNQRLKNPRINKQSSKNSYGNKLNTSFHSSAQAHTA